MNYYQSLRPILLGLPAETAHTVAIKALKYGLLPKAQFEANNSLKQNIFELEFSNPVGIAAGFDKNAEVIAPLFEQGFGFAEAGTVTPRAQPGNPKPRIFRLKQDKAVINRLGFNNEGAGRYVQNVKKWQESKKKSGVFGANIGKNKDTADAISDYIKMLEYVYEYADYITVNISSPNTPGLRDLQHKSALEELVSALVEKRSELTNKHGLKKPILIKIAPDNNDESLQDIADITLKHSIDSLIISNTTISRDNLKSSNTNENGGLSGKPLFDLSTNILKEFYSITKGNIPIIGVGGISSPEDAYTKIRNGASLIQIYTAFIYQGFGLVQEINKKLPKMLKADGFENISEAIGADT